MNKTYDAWLSWGTPDIKNITSPDELAAAELTAAGINGITVSVDESMGESWAFDGNTIRGGKSGVLYGAYSVISAKITGKPAPSGCKPAASLRMLNCWDNMDGNIERGYAGQSLFYKNGHFCYDRERMISLGRMLASSGVNVLCVNNVNVHEPAQELIKSYLPELAELAGIFRVFGVRLMVSIDFSMPIREGVGTADPLDEKVIAWWNERAKIVWNAIPDLAGFLVKADSEHRPGPFTYGRNHAEGANLLARAVKPFGGIVVWRCFVYNCMQDWRDKTTDRPKAAYDTYMPLDGQFDDNVILQIKNGPYDFQVREPVSPLLLGLKHTNVALELQLAQEYTGQQIDIYAMPPMWKEILDDLNGTPIPAFAAVTNLGNDANYTGHPFAALNLYAYGRLAVNPDIDPEEVIRDWCRLTYRLDEASENTLTDILLNSRKTYELYTAPLALDWMVTPNSHYGPNPYGYEFQAWGTYNRADRNGVGIDRTDRGTGYIQQYPEPLASLYNDVNTCPDELLLFFHRLNYDFVMKDGRTLIQRIYDDRFEGYERAVKMRDTLLKMPLPTPDRDVVIERAYRQVINAKEWCDILNTFFHRFSGIDDAHGRTIYD